LAIDHPSVMHTRRETIYEDGDWKSVLVVETGLQIDPDRPDYDAKEVERLQYAIVEFMKAHVSVVDAVYLRSKRGDA
jgi:hypothetical protein